MAIISIAFEVVVPPMDIMDILVKKVINKKLKIESVGNNKKQQGLVGENLIYEKECGDLQINISICFNYLKLSILFLF